MGIDFMGFMMTIIAPPGALEGGEQNANMMILVRPPAGASVEEMKRETRKQLDEQTGKGGGETEKIGTETIQVGAEVPDFTLNTYEPQSGDFGSISLADLKSSGKWTILFFYPADFTFV